MYYHSQYLKWQAFKYNDPLAANKFYVCDINSKLCCRPNCNMGFNSEYIEDVYFAPTKRDAINKGYNICQHCLPNLTSNSEYIENENFVIIDLKLLLSTIKNVNKNIGFASPILGYNQEFLTKSIMKIKNTELKNKILQLDYGGNFDNNIEIKGNSSKNDLEHLKLIDLACRHIALAAQSTIFGIKFIHYNNENYLDKEDFELMTDYDRSENDNEIINDSDYDGYSDDNNLIDFQDQSNEIDDEIPIELEICQLRKSSFYMQHRRLKTKKRRGGVLGFKELAAKSQLSPWHFHRTFKNMTGITPKQYGDKCFKYLNSKKSKYIQSLKSPDAIIMNAKLANPSFVSDINKIYLKKTSPPSLLTLTSSSSLSDLEPEPYEENTSNINTENLESSNITINPISKCSSSESSSPIIQFSTVSLEIQENELRQQDQQQYPYDQNSSQYTGNEDNFVELQHNTTEFTTKQIKPNSLEYQHLVDNTVLPSPIDFTLNFNSGIENDSEFTYDEEPEIYNYSDNFDIDTFSIDENFLWKQLQLQNSLDRRFKEKSQLSYNND